MDKKTIKRKKRVCSEYYGSYAEFKAELEREVGSVKQDFPELTDDKIYVNITKMYPEYPDYPLDSGDMSAEVWLEYETLETDVELNLREITEDTIRKFKENVVKKSSFTLLYGDNWNIDQKKSFFNGLNFWRRILSGVDISPYYASNARNAEQAGVCVNIYGDLPTEEWLKKVMDLTEIKKI